jgi:hypothetical protein
MNNPVIIDQAELHAKEEARETAGDLYRHAPLPWELTKEGRKEYKKKQERKYIAQMIARMEEGYRRQK